MALALKGQRSRSLELFELVAQGQWIARQGKEWRATADWARHRVSRWRRQVVLSQPQLSATSQTPGRRVWNLAPCRHYEGTNQDGEPLRGALRIWLEPGNRIGVTPLWVCEVRRFSLLFPLYDEDYHLKACADIQDPALQSGSKEQGGGRGESKGGKFELPERQRKKKEKRPAVLASSVSNEYILQDKTVLPER